MQALWAAAFAGPLAWTLHNLLSAALVSAACAWAPGLIVLHGLTLATLGLSVGGAIVGARHYTEGAADGARFVAVGSVMLGVLFALVILAEGVPNLILGPCWS